MSSQIDCSASNRQNLSGQTELELTFRDPAGQLRLTQDHALRRIHPAAAEDTLAFLDSPLRAALERSGDLVCTQIAQIAQIAPSADDSATESGMPGELWLQHPRIHPISYPWEWNTAQWLAAADLTLRIADQAIDAGWMLKDATPLNVLFVGSRPVLVDVLSLERRDPRSTVWPAYGQFVRTFLLPLLAEKYLKWSLQATIFARDGYEPRTIYRALDPWQRLYPDLIDVVTLATLFEKPGAAAKKSVQPRASSVSDPELAAHILHKRLARLGKQVRRAARTGKSTEWKDYQQTASHYRSTDTQEKQAFIEKVMESFRPKHVLDIGANTGTYSIIAARAGAEVVALDNDAGALETLGQAAQQGGHRVSTLVANIARPTPASGWRNREQFSLLQRLTGKFDMVLMLAVIHHLILREQIPLPHIADLCAGLTTRWMVVEWVPPSDPMFQEWLRGRDHLYGNLSEDDLHKAFGPFFHVLDRTVLGNGRVLLLLERNTLDESNARVSPA